MWNLASHIKSTAVIWAIKLLVKMTFYMCSSNASKYQMWVLYSILCILPDTGKTFCSLKVEHNHEARKSGLAFRTCHRLFSSCSLPARLHPSCHSPTTVGSFLRRLTRWLIRHHLSIFPLIQVRYPVLLVLKRFERSLFSQLHLFVSTNG